ncbi:PaaI family thioesterase [Roseicyclus sp. F158]|uniref:PaaI family thioesterase n=1 Tax=Tropicimonas omnivorans TaxID=3075590 RepID=A0ABU3DKP9_9RHOB|nr:PaaI family thioesterase [Roseicyclus sp. F158]MDT0684290.1 PaaI family thioesterase [Roseicyclus sp. F158]
MTDAETSPDGWKTVRADGYVDLIGPLLRRTIGGETVYGLQTAEKHRNFLGLVHGGVLTGLLDQVLAVVAWNAADRAPTVTVQMDTRFLGAAKAGDFLEVHARLRHATRSLIFIDGDISSRTGPIAAASAVMKIARQTEAPR